MYLQDLRKCSNKTARLNGRERERFLPNMDVGTRQGINLSYLKVFTDQTWTPEAEVDSDGASSFPSAISEESPVD